MKPLLTGTRSIHEILSTFGNAGLLASAGITSPVAFWAILISGFGLTLRNIIAESKEETTLEDLAALIEELAASNDPSLSEGLVAKPADMALAFEEIPEMRALPAWEMAFDDIRRPWLLLVQWLDTKFKSATADNEAIAQVLRSLREGLDTRLAILTAEQRELFTHRSKEVTDHVNATAATFTQKLAAIHDDVLESRLLNGEGHATTHKELKEIKDHLHWQPNPPPTFQNIPHARRTDFTGRVEDVQEISVRLTGLGVGGVLPFVLHGPPGVGKTTLACEVLHRLHSLGTLTHILHVPSSDPCALTSLLEALATRLQLVPGQFAKIDTAVALGALHSFLQSTQKKVLLFFDNADSSASIAAVAQILQDFGHPPALVTSRQSDWPEADCCQLRLWTEDDASDYLLRRLPNLTVADRDLLAASLGGLPIAFDLAVGAMLRFRITASTLIQRWKTKLAGEKIPARGKDYTVEALLDVSLESLTAEAADLLYLLAQFAPLPIPMPLLEQIESPTLHDDFATLASASLAVWEDQGICLHPFIRDILLQTISADDRIPIFTVALSLLATHLPPPEWSVEGWKEWPALLPHVDALEEQFESGSPTRGNYTEALEYFSHILNQSALYHHHRAAVHEAEPLVRRALEVVMALHGENDPRVVAGSNNLAQILQATDRLPEAETLLRRCLSIREVTVGYGSPLTALSLQNLAGLLFLTNRPLEAEPLMRRALEINETFYGKEHTTIAVDLNNLGGLLMNTKRLVEAEPLLRRALAIDEICHGKNHPSVARDLGNLAQLLRNTNRLEEAKSLICRALEINEASLGRIHPDVGYDLNNLAGVLIAMDRLREAEPVGRRALQIVIEFGHRTGHQHPEFLTILSNYNGILHKLGWPKMTIARHLGVLLEQRLHEED